MIGLKNLQRKIALVMLAVLSVTLVLHVLSLDRGKIAIVNYIVPMTAMFIGMYVFQGKLGRRHEYYLGLALVVWYVVCRVLDGELYMETSYPNFSHFFYMYGMVLPFAFLADDAQRRTGLKIVALVLFVLLGAAAWIGVGCVYLDTGWVLPVLGTSIRIDRASKRLALGYHANISAAFMLCALMLGLWYAFENRKRWFTPIAVFFGVGLFAAIALTVSRTVMIQFGFVVAGAVMLAILKKAPRKPARVAAAVAAGLVCFVGVYELFGLTVQVVLSLPTAFAETIGERPLSIAELVSVNGRTQIYQNVFRLMGDYPSTWAVGLSSQNLLKLCERYTGTTHPHNNYLHMLLLLGVPGFLFSVWLTVRVVVAAFRVAFTNMARSAMSDKLIALMTVSLLISTVSEVYLFADFMAMVNFVFLLLSGYLIETDRRLCQKA